MAGVSTVERARIHMAMPVALHEASLEAGIKLDLDLSTYSRDSALTLMKLVELGLNELSDIRFMGADNKLHDFPDLDKLEGPMETYQLTWPKRVKTRVQQSHTMETNFSEFVRYSLQIANYAHSLGGIPLRVVKEGKEYDFLHMF